MEQPPPLKPPAPPDDPGQVVVPSARRLIPRRLTLAAAAAAAIAAITFVLLGSGDGTTKATTAAQPAAEQAEQAEPARADDVPAAQAVPPSEQETREKPLRSRPKVVVAVPPGEAPPAVEDATSTPPVSRPATDAEIRKDLTAFREHLTGAGVARGQRAEVRPDGTAVAPLEAPEVVARVMGAANEIATKPYKWGGGHGAWRDSGYDCSGSVSFALAGAGLLNAPMTSGGFERYGAKGPGRWITIYANGGHMFMVVAGLRFDTSGARGARTRWQPTPRSTAGFKVRHPPGL